MGFVLRFISKTESEEATSDPKRREKFHISSKNTESGTERRVRRKEAESE